MSDITIAKTTIKSKCAKCNHEIEIDVYPVIDLQKNSELYEDLFSLNLFRHVCPECKHTNIIQYNTLVIDRYKNYMVYLYAPTQMEFFRKDINNYLDSLNKSGNKEILQVIKNLKHTRVVNSVNDLIEKLLIYDYNLNDKIIELLKRGLYQNKMLDQTQFNCIAFNKIQQDTLLFTCFNVQENQIKQAKDISVRIDYYNMLIDTLGKATDQIKETDFPLINKQWAKNIINMTRNN